MSATRLLGIVDGVHLELVLNGTPVEYDLPMALRRTYGSDLGLAGRRVYANFVSSVDGVVALGVEHSPSIIGRHSQADRFVMGLLRARADAVLIGGGTMRADPGHRWTADHVYPDAANEFRQLRRINGQDGGPRLVVVTASGKIDAHEGALEGAIVVTSASAESDLRRRMPSTTEIRAFDRVTPPSLLRMLRDDGLDLVLSEAGPDIFGQLVEERCLDDLFLTLSPVLAGSAVNGRKTLAEGTAIADRLSGLDLVSARRHGSHLFLRYSTGGTGRRPEDESSSKEEEPP